MRVKEIRIEGLFGMFDHVIPLNMEDHITIIHGANGFGKTVLLQMVYGLLHGSIDSIIQIPFRRFEVSFDDNSNIWIDGSENNEVEDRIPIGDFTPGYLTRNLREVEADTPVNQAISCHFPKVRQSALGNKISKGKNTILPDIQTTHIDSLAPKIQLLKDIINKRFLYKTVEVSSDLEFSFTDRNGKAVPITALSSGEQHVLVLFYQLIFEMPPNSLILIDEPELSLHVVWQQYFLKDLQHIIAHSSFDVIMATHSPQIIHDRWDLTVELNRPSYPIFTGDNG